MAKLYKYKGKTLSAGQLADIFNINPNCVYSRLHRGWDINKALTTPVDKSNVVKSNVVEYIKENCIVNDNDCWIWTKGTNNSGYGSITHNQIRWQVHRLMYFESNKNKDSNLFVCHKCDEKLCCNPDHMFLGTNSDNLKDYYSKPVSDLTRYTHSINASIKNRSNDGKFKMNKGK